MRGNGGYRGWAGVAHAKSVVGALLPAALILAMLVSCKPQPALQHPAFVPAPLVADVAAFTAHLDQLVPRLLAGYGVPGASLALVHHGAVVWANGYGVANRANRTPVTPDTDFRVYSISKSLTAWGVMRLVEQGRLDLDTPVEQYLTRWHL